MKSAGEWTIDVILLVLMTLYAFYASFHMAAMWKLRREFYIALRSPLLACICGACRCVRSCITTFSAVFDGLGVTHGVFGAVKLIAIPALLVGNSALIAWVIRLLVLYDPQKRKAWGSLVNEKRAARALCWTVVGMEAAIWAAVAVYRTVVTGLILGTPGLPAIVLKYWVLFLAISKFGLVSWTINVKPVREFLRNTNGEKQHSLIGWWGSLGRTGRQQSMSRVACSSAGTTGIAKTTLSRLGSGDIHVNEGPLATIMGFVPLKQAFGEFCRKGLCSESFQFLVDTWEFHSSVEAAHNIGQGNDYYEEFMAIVNEYIRDNSNSEINIDSRTKKKILGFEERSSFDSLGMENRSGLFLQAQREIAMMLADNLLSKFKATHEYKEVADELLFETK